MLRYGVQFPDRDGTSQCVVINAYNFESSRLGSNPEWGLYTMRLRSLDRAYLSLHLSGVVHRYQSS